MQTLWSRRAGGLLGVLVAIVAATAVAMAPRVAAETCSWSNEQEFLDTTCRSTFLVDPGSGQKLSKEQILENSEYYEALGYPRDALERMVEGEMTFTRGDGNRWTACPAGTGPHCDVAEVREGAVMDAFEGDSVTLSVFYDPVRPSRYIVRGCGNGSSTADTKKTGMLVVDPPTRLDVDEPATVTIRATIANGGSAKTVVVDDTLTVTPRQADCTVDPPQQTVRRTLHVDQPVDIDFVVTVQCGHRSDHTFDLRNDVRLVGEDTEERNPANNTMVKSWDVAVFDEVDLAVDAVAVDCGERKAGPSTFRCSVTGTVTNLGPADDVSTDTVYSLAAPADCVAVAADPTNVSGRLRIDVPVTSTVAWDVTCTGAVRHVFFGTTAVAVASDDPHVVDTDAGNDQRRSAWVPIDVKPRSDPSSINGSRQGLIPVAILATPDFDPFTTIDVDTLRFGATGTEPSLNACKADGEDVNDDGFSDMVCHFDATKAGFTCADTVGTLTGTFFDGTPFQGTDTVKITPCK